MLRKQSLDINFAQGIDTKTDPWQTDPNTFLSLNNSVFTTGKRLTKRNGFKTLASLPDSSSTYLATTNDNLTAVGNSIYSYNQSDNTWLAKGSIQPLELNTLPVIRNNINQIQSDIAIAQNGLGCVAYTETNAGTTDYRYAIFNSSTGANVIPPSPIPVASGTVTGSPRVFVLGNYFIVAFTNVISATAHLQYVAISTANQSIVTANTDIASAYIPASTVAWDGVVVNERLFLAYNTTTGGQSIKVTYLSSNLILAAPLSFTGSTYIATMFAVAADITVPSNPAIYISFYNEASGYGYIVLVNYTLQSFSIGPEILSPAFGTIVNITAAAQNGGCTVFAETENSYGYDASLPSNFIQVVGIFANGTALYPSSYTIVRSVGLASKAFIVSGTIYFLSAYQSGYQNTYFLINGSQSIINAAPNQDLGGETTYPVIAAKVAYENGGGYLSLGLPSVTVLNGNDACVAYLYKDLIAATAKATPVSSTAQTAQVYSQTGINLASFTVGTENVDTAEIAQNLHVSGGFLWAYDGYVPVEHNFFVWPDNVEAATQADPTPTGTVSNVTNPSIITAISSVAGIAIGMTISGTGIPANTKVLAVGTTTVTMSANATSAHSAETITFTGNQSAQQYYYQATYEWTDNQGNAYRSAPSIPITVTTSSGNSSVVINIPTLRLTYKTANPVKIVIYRWSVGQQVYYQTTSISSAIINSTAVDYISYIDVNSDAQILGNNIIYTNGGVVEDINAPGSNVLTLFDDRLWLVDAEDQNLLWFSKQVIETTPVEMSDLFTFYVAPTQGAQGSTGPITALAPMDDKLIIFKKEAIYYINGTGPDNTGSNSQYSQPIFITATVGCANQQSIVFQPAGLMFQSDKGIWLLGRDLSTQYIGAPVEAFNSSLVNSALSVPATNQVRFTLSTGQTLMYDYFYGQWGTFTGAPAISSTIFQGLHTILNQYGAAYQESPGSYLDGANPVLISFSTSWFKLAGLHGYQRAFWFYLLGRYLSPHKLQVLVAYDFNTAPLQSSLISPTNYAGVFGGPNPNPQNGLDYADPFGQDAVFGGPGTGEYGAATDLEQWRVFLTKQRCQAIQLTVQEIYDASFGVPAGQGLTFSGIKLTYSAKSSFRPMPASESVGGGTA